MLIIVFCFFECIFIMEVIVMDRRSGNVIFTKGFRSDFVSFAGVDLHQSTVTLFAVDSDQEIISNLTTSTKCIDKIGLWIESLPKPCWMAVEAVGFIEWFLDRFKDSLARMDIADATELANRRGKRRKTDPNDALDIALRLAIGDCPLGYTAPSEIMNLRKMGRHWRRLTRTMTTAKHGMKSMLSAANIHGPKFDGASAQKWLLAHGHLLRPYDYFSFGDLLDIVCLIERQRESLRRKIHKTNRSEDFIETTKLLKTVKGIGEIWACIIAAEVGSFARFPNADAIEFWAGLTPDTKESAGRTQSGNITKIGPSTLRWALAEAASTLCQSDAKQERTRQRLIARIGNAKANVAMARRLLRILFAMAKNNTPYICEEPRDRTAKANIARAKIKQRKERELMTVN
jgi:transposase